MTQKQTKEKQDYKPPNNNKTMTIIYLYCALVLYICSVFLTIYVWSKVCDIMETRRYAKMNKIAADKIKSSLLK